MHNVSGWLNNVPAYARTDFPDITYCSDERHQQPQAIASVGCGYHPLPVFLQQVQLDRIAVNAQ